MLKQRCPILHISTKCHHWNLRISRTLASQFTRTGRRTGAARDHTTRGGWLERSDHTVIGVITAQCVLAENRWAGSAASRRCCQILNFSLGSFWYFLRWLFWPRCRSNRWKTKRHLRNQVKETNICNHVKDIYWKAYWQLTSQHHRTASWPLTNRHHGRASWHEHVGSHLALCLMLEPGCTLFVHYIYSYLFI